MFKDIFTEENLKGTVLPVGGNKEKILEAHRAGVKKVILPKENARDLEEVPEDVRGELTFVMVETIEEVLKEAPGIDLPHGPVAETIENRCVLHKTFEQSMEQGRRQPKIYNQPFFKKPVFPKLFYCPEYTITLIQVWKLKNSA
jgi:predicted ATP-dependent protease